MISSMIFALQFKILLGIVLTDLEIINRISGKAKVFKEKYSLLDGIGGRSQGRNYEGAPGGPDACPLSEMPKSVRF